MKIKKLITVLLCSCAIIFSLQNVYALDSEYGNLIENADLENADSSFCNPYTSYFLGIDDTVSHSGSKSVKVKVTASWAHLVQITPKTVLVPGNKYIISFWYYTDVDYDSDAVMTCVLNNGAAITSGMSRAKITTGKWTKYSCIFTAQDGTDVLKYLYPAVAGGSTYSATNMMWFDDFNLRRISDTKTDYISSEIVDNNFNNASFKFSFNNEPDIYDIESELYLNGDKLDKQDFEFTLTQTDTSYDVNITLLKKLAPLNDYDIKIGKITDVCEVNINDSDFQKIAFKSSAEVDVSAWYYKTSDVDKSPITSPIYDEDISLAYTLKNNTNEIKHTYLVSVMCDGDSIREIMSISDITLAENEQSQVIVSDLNKISDGCYIRTFCWSSLTSDNLRAFNEVIELK